MVQRRENYSGSIDVIARKLAEQEQRRTGREQDFVRRRERAEADLAAIKARMAGIESGSETVEDSVFKRLKARETGLSSAISGYTASIDSLQQRRMASAYNAANTGVLRSMDPDRVRGDIAGMRSGYTTGAYNLANDPNYNADLAAARGYGQLAGFRRRTEEALRLGGMADPTQRKILEQIGREQRGVEGSIAEAQEVGRIQRRERTDVQGSMDAARSMMQRYAGIQQKHEIASDVAAGKFDRGEVEKDWAKSIEATDAALKELTKTARELADTQRDLDHATDESTRNQLQSQKEALLIRQAGQQGELNTAAGNAQAKQLILDEMKRQGGGLTGMQRFARGMEYGGAAMSAMGSAFTGMAGLELRDQNIQTAFANLANRQYQDVAAMGQGDASATLRLIGNAYRNAEKFGNEQVGRALTGTALSTTGGVIGSIGNAVGAAFVRPDQAGTAIMGVVGAGVEAGVTAKAVERGVLQGEARYAGIEANLARFDAITAPMASQINQYQGAFMGAAGSVRGYGSQADAAHAAIMDKSGVLSGLGLNTEARANLISGLKMATSNLRGDAIGQAAATAGALYQRGYLSSPGQYAEMMGQIGGVGGTESNLKDILQAAVAQGMDQSKQLSSMVAGIAAMGRQSAMVGINTAAGATERVTAITSSLKGAISPDLLPSVAANTASVMDKFSSSEGYNMGTIYASAVGRKLGITDTADWRLFSRATTTQLGSVRDAYKRSRQEGDMVATQLGLSNMMGDFRKGKFGKLDEAIQSKVVQTGIESGAVVERGAESIQRIARGQGTEAERLAMAKSIAAADPNANVLGVKAHLENRRGPRGDDITKPPTEQTGALGISNTINQTAAQSEQGQQRAGEKQVQNAGFKDFADYAQNVNKIMQGVDWEQLAKMPQEAASNMSTTIGSMDKTIKSFDTVMTKVVEKLEKVLVGGTPGSKTEMGQGPTIYQQGSMNAEDRQAGTQNGKVGWGRGPKY